MSALAGRCGQGYEPIAEPGSRDAQGCRQTRSAEQAPVPTFDPQPTADPLVTVIPGTHARSAGQGEAADGTCLLVLGVTLFWVPECLFVAVVFAEYITSLLLTGSLGPLVKSFLDYLIKYVGLSFFFCIQIYFVLRNCRQ